MGELSVEKKYEWKNSYPDRMILAGPSARVARPTRLME